MRAAVDVMGGDKAPEAILQGCWDAVRLLSGDDVLYLVGGIIPDEDIDPLKKLGVDMIFTPGASIDGVVDYIKKNVKARPVA